VNTNDDTIVRGYEETYIAALALYEVLRASGMVQVRRAEAKQGEVKAEPIDFVCDIEMRAARTLSLQDWLLKWWDVLEEPWRYPDLPKEVQELGKAFLENDLGVEGHYRTLYFRVKNQLERKKFKETDDANAGYDILNDAIEYGATTGRYPSGDPYPSAGESDGETDQGTETPACDET